MWSIRSELKEGFVKEIMEDVYRIIFTSFNEVEK